METQIDRDMIDITPNPHILLGMSAQNMPWWKSLGELIDNSLDAKANRVSIKCHSRTVVVTDDGLGMPDVAVAVTMGGHASHGESALGRYGVGLKDAWRSAGERIEITTVRGGTKSHLDFSVDSIQVHDHQWKLPRPITAQTSEKTGTRIVLHLRPGKNKPGTDCWEMIGWAFSPALLTGRQIVHGNEKTLRPISPAKFPSLVETVCDSLVVCGKDVKINIGIMAQGEKIFKGPFWVQYGHRNIVPTSLGVGQFDDKHLAGTIVLGDNWKLTKNKDDFDDHKDELSAAIHERIKPLLVKAAAMSQDIESSALTAEIAGMLNAAIINAKREKRSPTKETSGTVVATNSDRKRRNATHVHPDVDGKASGEEGPAKRTGFTLGWYSEEDGLPGHYDYHANRIKLNDAHVFVGGLKREKNTLGLYAVAAAILADHHCSHDGASRLLLQTKEFPPAFSFITRRMQCPK